MNIHYEETFQINQRPLSASRQEIQLASSNYGVLEPEVHRDHSRSQFRPPGLIEALTSRSDKMKKATKGAKINRNEQFKHQDFLQRTILMTRLANNSPIPKSQQPFHCNHDKHKACLVN